MMGVKTVGILDYGLGNMLSIRRAFDKLEVSVVQVITPEDFNQCTHLLLPGVGAFAEGMKKLKEKCLIEPLKAWHHDNRPLLGICLGMQMLLSKSFEFGVHEGLGFIPGEVKALRDLYPVNDSHKVPHIGWANVCQPNDAHIGKFYFVHSFAAFVDNKQEETACYTHNGVKIPAIIQKDNTIGVQFHPEKSAEDGINFLRQFLEMGDLA